MDLPTIDLKQSKSQGDSLTKDAAERARRRFLGVWTAVGVILLTAAAVYMLNILSVPMGIVLWSVVIVFCLRGPVNRLEKSGIPRIIGTGIAYILMFAALALVSLVLFSPMFGVGDQFTNLLESVPGYTSSIASWGNDFYSRYSDVFANAQVQQYLNDALDALASWASDLARSSATSVVAIGTGVVNTIISIGFALVIAFWILIELPDLGREALRFAGPKHAETLQMFHVAFTRVMAGFIRGTILQCAIIGVGCGVVFGFLGLPNYAALGGIAGLLNVIPIVGPWLGGALAAIIGVFVSPWVGLAALIATVVIQQVVYTFISPKIMSDSVDVHPALTLLALMAGSAIGGAMSGLMGSLVGMLASIPAVAVAKPVFVYYFEKRTGRQLVSEDGVFFQGTPSRGLEPDPIADATSPHPDISAAFERIEQRKAEGKTGIRGRVKNSSDYNSAQHGKKD